MNQNYLVTCDADHNAKYMNDCFSVSPAMSQKLRHMIFFVFVSNHMKSEELYDDRDLAPRELTTVTGDLVQFLKMTETQQEYEWGLLNFMHLHEMAQAAYGKYKINTNDLNSFDPEERDRVKKIRAMDKFKDMLEELRDSFHDKENDDYDVEPEDEGAISMKFMTNKCVPYVKKSKYHFPTYYKMATGKTLASEQGFLDDVLSIANTPDPDL